MQSLDADVVVITSRVSSKTIGTRTKKKLFRMSSILDMYKYAPKASKGIHTEYTERWPTSVNDIEYHSSNVNNSEISQLLVWRYEEVIQKIKNYLEYWVKCWNINQTYCPLISRERWHVLPAILYTVSLHEVGDIGSP